MLVLCTPADEPPAAASTLQGGDGASSRAAAAAADAADAPAASAPAAVQPKHWSPELGGGVSSSGGVREGQALLNFTGNRTAGAAPGTGSGAVAVLDAAAQPAANGVLSVVAAMQQQRNPDTVNNADNQTAGAAPGADSGEAAVPATAAAGGKPAGIGVQPAEAAQQLQHQQGRNETAGRNHPSAAARATSSNSCGQKRKRPGSQGISQQSCEVSDASGRGHLESLAQEILQKAQQCSQQELIEDEDSLWELSDCAHELLRSIQGVLRRNRRKQAASQQQRSGIRHRSQQQRRLSGAPPPTAVAQEQQRTEAAPPRPEPSADRAGCSNGAGQQQQQVTKISVSQDSAAGEGKSPGSEPSPVQLQERGERQQQQVADNPQLLDPQGVAASDTPLLLGELQQPAAGAAATQPAQSAGLDNQQQEVEEALTSHHPAPIDASSSNPTVHSSTAAVPSAASSNHLAKQQQASSADLFFSAAGPAVQQQQQPLLPHVVLHVAHQQLPHRAVANRQAGKQQLPVAGHLQLAQAAAQLEYLNNLHPAFGYRQPTAGGVSAASASQHKKAAADLPVRTSPAASGVQQQDNPLLITQAATVDAGQSPPAAAVQQAGTSHCGSAHGDTAAAVGAVQQHHVVNAAQFAESQQQQQQQQVHGFAGHSANEEAFGSPVESSDSYCTGEDGSSPPGLPSVHGVSDPAVQDTYYAAATAGPTAAAALGPAAAGGGHRPGAQQLDTAGVRQQLQFPPP